MREAITEMSMPGLPYGPGGSRLWSRVGPASGLLFVFVSLAGFMIHGYPAISPSDGQLQEWIKVTDLNRFTVGVYIEALGYLFLLPFVAWLYTTLRSATGYRPWTAVLALAAGAGYVVLVLPINESWVGILEQGKQGLDVRVSQTLVSTSQAWFSMSNMMLGLFLIAAGLAILQTRAIGRWAGWAAVAIGALGMMPGGVGILAGFAILPWLLGVGAYYSVRPLDSNPEAAAHEVQPF